MAYVEPVHGVTDARQVTNLPRKPRVLLAASGTVAAIKFGNLCSCFSYWVDVKAVATLPALHFIDKTTLSKDVILYTDEHEWSSWSKIGDRVLHIELRQWADVMEAVSIKGTRLQARADTLKDAVKMMIHKGGNQLNTLQMIDDLQRLGISYHFEDEIRNLLEMIYCNYCKTLEEWNGMDLNLKALGF
ncbi:putative phosphopantothenoylcysteine decarboxylase [Helianthus annuus]|nr:putative phosphopantothenoylcysteine decarboxylase [Helianthus annuus]